MIDLTPLEVRKKKGDFRRAMRGYDAQSVDDFLDLVADRLEQLVRENAAFSERITSIESQVADYRERERALTEALVTAQEMREEMRKQMEREVELKLREAEADAEAVRNEVAKMREREEESIRRLRARQAQFIQSYRAFLERELSELSVMSETLDLDATPAPEPPRRKRVRREAPASVIAPDIAQAFPEPEPARAQLQPEPETELEPEPEAEPAPEPHVGSAPTFVAGPGPDLFDEPLPFEREPIEPDQELLDLTQHLPPLPDEEEVPELELLDEVSDAEPEPEALTEDEDDDRDDNDNGGWVSTLLEGKGD